METKICVAVGRRAAAELEADAEPRALAARPGFLVELRLDLLSGLDGPALDRLLARFPGKSIVTCRRPDEGGGREDLSDDERLGFLTRAVRHGAKNGPAAVDCELRSRDRLPELRRALDSRPPADRPLLVLSFHDFQGVPANLETVRRNAEALGADVVKLAVTPATACAARPLLEMLSSPAAPGRRRPLIALAMGEAGLWTRLLAPRFGAPWTYARLAGNAGDAGDAYDADDAATGTAPGQPTYRELETLYRFFEQRPEWPVYGVLGNPVGHSLSPLLHNTALRETGLPGVYVPFLLEDDPVSFVRDFGDGLGLRGLSVTIPHKERVREACAELSAAVRECGAANTLTRREDGSWAAENTDATAAVDALEEKLGGAGALRGRTILLLGAGGAGKAAAFGIRERGGELLIRNRTRRRAEELAAKFGGEVVEYGALPAVPAGRGVAAVVNTTPLGMYPKTDASPLTAAQIPAGAVVFDTIYNPLQTKLLKLAAEKGCPTLDGTAMFVAQGARQFELWTGQAAPRSKSAAVVRNELEKRAKREEAR